MEAEAAVNAVYAAKLAQLPEELAGELTRRFAAARGKRRPAVRRRHPISPV